MNTRGQYGTKFHGPMGRESREYGTREKCLGGHVRIGLKLFHTPGDKQRAIDQINSEINALVDTMYRAMGVNPAVRKKLLTTQDIRAWLKHMESVSKGELKEELDTWRESALEAGAKAKQSPLWTFWDTYVSPVYSEWTRFLWDQQFWDFFTSWEEYEQWFERVRQLRETIEAKGIRLETPPPLDLTRTLPGAVIEAGGKAAQKAGEAVLEIGKIAKWTAIGALVVGGVFAVTSLVTTVRKGKEPLEHYTGLYRTRTGPRLSVVPRLPRLPSSPKLGLPPGQPIDI